jgi:hypothetical protein
MMGYLVSRQCNRQRRTRASNTTAVPFSNKFVDFCIEGFGFERAPVATETQMDDVAGARRGIVKIQWRGQCAYERLGEAIFTLPHEQRQSSQSTMCVKRLVAS